MEWQYFKTFFIVGEFGSMSLAAKELHTTQATVSRHTQLLEDALGHQLIKRTVSGSQLTPIGLKIHEKARKMYHAACAVEQIITTHKQSKRRVVISCGEMTSVLLSKNLAVLQKGLDNVEIIITSTNKFIDLAAGEADVVIRNQMHDQDGFIYKPLEQASLERYSIYGNAATFKNITITPKNFGQFNWVIFSKTKVKLQTDWLKKHVPPSAIKYRVHHAALVMDILTTTPNTLAILPRFVGEALSEVIEVFTPKEDLSFKRYIVRRDDNNQKTKQVMLNIENIFIQIK
ncbi:MAG: LysR family transcriptional regulator [Bdellovibrionota bacterium]